MNHGSLFSGIGGFDLPSDWMGWNNQFHCEWNPFGQRVLKYYWPKAKSYDDITKTDFTIWRGKIDILTGGFPCQPYSSAGKRLGKEDDRHLWPEMLRAIREIQPRWVVGENVLGLTNWNGGLVFEEVQADLEAQGYEVQPFILPAASVGAPHRRDRVWFVTHRTDPRSQSVRKRKEHAYKLRPTADSKSESGGGELQQQPRQRELRVQNSGNAITPNPDGLRRSKQEHGKKESRLNPETDKRPGWENFPTKSPICVGNDGLPTQLDGITFPKWRNESIKAYGNAVVPQVVYQIFKAIEEYERNNN